MCSDTDDYIPSYPRPAWDDVSFDPEDGDIFDEWLNGGDDGRQEAAWEAAIAVWDRDFRIGQRASAGSYVLCYRIYAAHAARRFIF